MALHDLTVFANPPCKSAPNVSDCEVIFCAQPSSGHPAAFLLHLVMGSSWVNSKPEFTSD